jgi:3-hydroxy acid dehydrogenase/malonic semialdehyde reductase
MILITGASSGIGEACAIEYAKKKKSLIIWARRSNRLQKLAIELKNLGCPEVHYATIDVSDRSQIESEIQNNSKIYSNVSILINGAGLALGLEAFQDSSLDDADRVIDTNLKGLLYVTHALLPIMIKNRLGHIVHLGSVAGRYNYPKGHVYCATKAAIKSLNESLRMDLLGTPIRMTEIAPGMVETEFSQVRLGDTEKAKKVYAGMTPLTAQDIAEAVVWSTERPRHVNIQEIILYPTDQVSPTQVYRKP